MRNAHAITLKLAELEPLDPWDLTVQVRHDDDGRWHRRAVLFGYTACGKVVTERTTSAMRHQSYEGHLCTEGCFTPWELEQSARINRDRREKEDR